MAEFQVQDEVLLPAYLGGGKATVVLVDAPVYEVNGRPTGQEPTPVHMFGVPLIGVTIVVEDGPFSGRYAPVMVPACDLRRPDCPTCGRPR